MYREKGRQDKAEYKYILYGYFFYAYIVDPWTTQVWIVRVHLMHGLFFTKYMLQYCTIQGWFTPQIRRVNCKVVLEFLAVQRIGVPKPRVVQGSKVDKFLDKNWIILSMLYINYFYLLYWMPYVTEYSTTLFFNSYIGFHYMDPLYGPLYGPCP